MGATVSALVRLAAFSQGTPYWKREVPTHQIPDISLPPLRPPHQSLAFRPIDHVQHARTAGSAKAKGRRTILVTTPYTTISLEPLLPLCTTTISSLHQPQFGLDDPDPTGVDES